MKYIFIGLISLIGFSFYARAQRPLPPRQIHLKAVSLKRPESKRDGIRMHRLNMRIKRHDRMKRELIFSGRQKQEKGS